MASASIESSRSWDELRGGAAMPPSNTDSSGGLIMHQRVWDGMVRAPHRATEEVRGRPSGLARSGQDGRCPEGIAMSLAGSMKLRASED